MTPYSNRYNCSGLWRLVTLQGTRASDAAVTAHHGLHVLGRQRTRRVGTHRRVPSFAGLLAIGPRSWEASFLGKWITGSSQATQPLGRMEGELPGSTEGADDAVVPETFDAAPRAIFGVFGDLPQPNRNEGVVHRG